MAYSTSNPPRLLQPSVGASSGAIWLYTSTDDIGTVAQADYFSNGDDLGMKVDDVMFVVDQTNVQHHEVIVSAVTAGGAATVGGVSASGGRALAAATTLTAAESGQSFYLSLAGGFTVTLPAPAVGLKYKFIVAIAPTTAYIIVTNASANIINGSVATPNVTAAGDVSVAASSDTITFVASTAVVGDYVELESDGTNWYLSGMTHVAGGITVTQAT